MKTQRQTWTRISAVAVTVGLFAMPVLLTADVAQAAKSANKKCWGFDALTLGQEYAIGDTYAAQYADIHIGQFLANGTLTSNPAAKVYANPSMIAKGTQPELRTYLARTKVVPKKPLTSVVFKFGFTNSANGPHANLGVNGDLREVTGSMANLNGQVLGRPALGLARVTVQLTNKAGQPESGTIKLQAVQGKIKFFSMGGLQQFIDDVCMVQR